MSTPPSRDAPATLLLIAGLDPSGGAGLFADARVAWEFGLRSAGAATVLTEQDSRGLRRGEPADAEFLGDQLRAVLADTEVAAVKVGALGSEAIAREVSAALELTAAPVVWDPVAQATSGAGALYAGDPAAALAGLAPHLSLVTPNLREAEALAGVSLPAEAEIAAIERAAETLAGRAGAALVTGGHASADTARDILASGGAIRHFDGVRIEGGTDVHGTGCALATAIAGGLARGAALEDAIGGAKAFVAARIRSPVRAGRGRPSVV